MDLNRFNTGDVIATLSACKHAFILGNKCREHSEQNRRACVNSLAKFVEESIVSGGAISSRAAVGDVALFHHWFEIFLVLAGVAYSLDGWGRCARWWNACIHLAGIICFGTCLSRQLYASGPAYLDWYSCFYVVLIHVFVLHGTVSVRRFMRSYDMEVLRSLVNDSSDCVATTARIRHASKIAGFLGVIGGASLISGIIIVYPYLFLDSFYLRTIGGTLFGVSSTVFFLVVAPVILMQECAVLAVFHIFCGMVLTNSDLAANCACTPSQSDGGTVW